MTKPQAGGKTPDGPGHLSACPAVFDLIQDGLFSFQDSETVLCNQPLREMLELEEALISREQLFQRLTSGAENGARARLDELLAGNAGEFQFAVTLPTGELRKLHITTCTQDSSSSRLVTGLVRELPVFQHLNDPKEALLLFNALFDSIEDGILILDPVTMAIQRANPAAGRIFGATAESLQQRTILNLLADSLRRENLIENITAKLVENVLDDKPILSESCFLLWEWIATYYHCTLGEVLKAALPSGLKLESEARVSLNDEYSRAMLELLSPKESMLLGIIKEKKGISVFELNNTVLKKGTLPVLKELLKKGAIHIDEEIRESYKARTETIVTLGAAMVSEEKLLRTLDLLIKIPKQREMLHIFLQENEDIPDLKSKAYPKKALLMKSGASLTVFNGLLKKEILAVYEQPIDRLEAGNEATRAIFPFYPAQQAAKLSPIEALRYE